MKLKELFSPEMTKYMIVVFNGMDELGDTIGIHLILKDVIPVSVFFGSYGVDTQSVYCKVTSALWKIVSLRQTY